MGSFFLSGVVVMRTYTRTKANRMSYQKREFSCMRAYKSKIKINNYFLMPLKKKGHWLLGTWV